MEYLSPIQRAELFRLLGKILNDRLNRDDARGSEESNEI